MDNQKNKCSFKKHSEIDAIIFCNECKKYFCNKCQNHHSEIFDDHKLINLNNSKELFIDICKENNHINKLEFFCKNHNTLYCGLSFTKIKEKGYGQHSDCNVCLIENIKNEKKEKIKRKYKSVRRIIKSNRKIN